MLAAGIAVGFSEVRLAVVANDLKKRFVGAGDALELDVEDGIDDVFLHQRAKAVFEAEAGIERGILGGGLAIEIELGGPPGPDAVFELTDGGAVALALAGLGEGGFGLDFEVSGLFEVVGIGDEVGFFLGARGWNGGNAKENGGYECHK